MGTCCSRPKNTVYPWGDTNDVSFSGGTLRTKYNFNAVLAAEYLTKYPERETSYVSKSDKYGGQKTTVSKITAYKDDGTGTQLEISGTGQVRGWSLTPLILVSSEPNCFGRLATRVVTQLQ